MGVPKFTRFICERYPCIIELLNEYQIPEFDHLYLDMNGIIHNCSHPNNANAHFRITEETIFKNIFHYVDTLFRTIKPQKVFFLAVDGVAPRAKINQQRGRRFRSAKDAEIAEAKALAKGEKLPEESRFDSNCITPGTLFMAKLTEQLKYFVQYKISTDKCWQKCKIILSGPEVPGEGEHKIMDYVRYRKSQPDYNPNIRHCFYGLDADLIMLSLCTHEPHFAVLREEVKYSKHDQAKSIEKTKFCLLYISLLREYMEHEFESMKDKLPFPFDLEKIIDDWILMGFLVGNDFIPHLPNLHIANGALSVLSHVYMKILPTLDGYINEAGTLNLERFEKFMEELAVIDLEHFTEHLADLKYFETKTGRRPNEHERMNYKKSKDSEEESSKTVNKALDALIQATEEILLDNSDDDENESDTESEMNNYEFLLHKQDYYMTKFEYQNVDADVMRSQAEAYVTAIQWNLNYYYNGCCSWSWYYPHHYAPYISDIKGFKDLKFDFDLGKPFLPFQQLLAVLPAASKALLPEAYQSLLTEEQSPIIDYYPEEFRTDLNEKKQDWEAVVLIPFINEDKLIKAMEPYNHKLTAEERKRNQHGPMNIFSYSEIACGTIIAPDYFPSIENYAKAFQIVPSEIYVPKEKLVKGLCKGVKLHVYYSGFPTMQHIKHNANLSKSKVKVFDHPSRENNMIITILPKESPSLETLASDILGKIVYAKWPYLLEAHVIGISTEDQSFSLIDSTKGYSGDNLKREDLKKDNHWNQQVKSVATSYKNRFGIDIGTTNVLIHAKPICGRRYICTSQGRLSLEKEWNNYPTVYAYQTIVRDIEVEGEGFKTHINITDIYTPKSICFMLGHPHYGAMGEVIEPGVNLKTGRVKVAMKVIPEPNLEPCKYKQNQLKMQYMYGNIAAQRLGISSHLLSRITGSIFVLPRQKQEQSEQKQQNIGLNLKFNKKNEELPGYTKKIEGQWLYGSKSIGLIRSYMERFPLLFEYLAQNVSNDIYHEDDIFPNTQELTEITKWLKEQPYRSIVTRNCDEEGLDPDVITKLENKINKYVNEEENKSKTILMQVKPHLLYKPGICNGNIPPDPQAQYQLFDRIINVREDSCVPLGYKGTIVGIHGVNGAEKSYDMLFDKPFVGNISFNNSSDCRRLKLLEAEFINISHGLRAEQTISEIEASLGTFMKKKTKSTSENNNSNSMKPSAFASFSKHDNFLPVFCKSQTQQPQGQSQVRVMKKNEPQSFPNSPIKKNNKNNNSSIPVNPVLSHVQNIPVIPVNTQINNKPQGENPNQPTEFQMLWNELHKSAVPSAPNIPSSADGSNVPFQLRPQKSMSFSARPPLPTTPQIPIPVQNPPQDPSAFLKAMLKISDDKSDNNTSQSSAGVQAKPFVFPSTPPVPQSAPTLYARQANKEEKTNVRYSKLLLDYFQMHGLTTPRFFYTREKNLFRAQIIFPNMKTFYGELCSDLELAADSVAMKAYQELNLVKAPKPQLFYEMRPPNVWKNIPPPPQVNIQSMMSPRPFPDPRMPSVRPPSSWNKAPHPPLLLQQVPGFIQNPQIQVNFQGSSGSIENKTEFKPQQSTSFVPLQAQKKAQKPREPFPNLKEKSKNVQSPKINSLKIEQVENPPVQFNENKTKVNTAENPPPQKVQKAPRPRKSRVAANFGGPPSNGSDAQ
ncbi:5'-3' exoribonuclease 1 isoform X2 [Chelonus insularis]|uniref:5'-3' exoribonuclease 1 isoform X2 n=1 Tax=Chelonus insularis TaxID=460826 RepID=UPI0015899897|nr:5'-3' exoribonuclease 1 isoform X2 [Chelonus insularis]